MGYYAVGSNDSPFADMHPGHDGCFLANPYIVFYHHRTFAVQRAIVGGCIQQLTHCLTMGIVGDEDTGTGEQVIADGDTMCACDMRTSTDGAIITNS